MGNTVTLRSSDNFLKSPVSPLPMEPLRFDSTRPHAGEHPGEKNVPENLPIRNNLSHSSQHKREVSLGVRRWFVFQAWGWTGSRFLWTSTSCFEMNPAWQPPERTREVRCRESAQPIACGRGHGGSSRPVCTNSQFMVFTQLFFSRDHLVTEDSRRTLELPLRFSDPQDGELAQRIERQVSIPVFPLLHSADDVGQMLVE